MITRAITFLFAAYSAFSFSASTTVEVSAFYHEDAGFNASKEVVGFYRSLEQMNTLMAAKGVNMTFAPTYVGTFTSSEMSASTDVFDGRSTMSGLDVSVQTKTNVGDLSVGIFSQGSGVVGNSQVTTDDTYVYETSLTRKVAIAGGYSLGRSDEYSATVLTIGHELLHAVGAAHDATGASVFNSSGSGRTDGFANTCANGYTSLMAENSVYTQLVNISLAGAGDCLGAGDVVDFINQYAAAVGAIQPSRDNRTLVVSAVENVNTQSFDITVTRSNTASSEAITLYIAGGYNDTGLGLEPITLAFSPSSSSETTSVSFDDVYPLFEAAKDSVNSTYVVATGENEVVAKTFDLLTINTLWTAQAAETDHNVDNGSSSSGGGSLGFGWAVVLLLAAALRKR